MSNNIEEKLTQRLGQWVLASELGNDPQQIHLAVEHLRRLGYEVQHSPTHGYQITLDRKLALEEIQNDLSTNRVGRRLFIYNRTASTSDVCWSAARSEANDGLVIVAEEQTSGRGRLGRKWFAPPGGSVLMSVLIFENPLQVTAHLLTLASAVATVAAIKQAVNISPQIRWPNDILVDARKVAGILVESRPAAGGKSPFVIGIGINCNFTVEQMPAELRQTATTLMTVSGYPVNRTSLIRRALQQLDRWLAAASAHQTEAIRRAWLDHCHKPMQRVRLQHAGRVFSGRVLDISPLEGLVLQSDDGAVQIFDPATTTLLV